MSKGLQKLPKSEPLENQQEEIIKKILEGEKITKETYSALPQGKQIEFLGAFRVGANRLGFEDRDKFLEKIDGVLSDDTRHSLWGMNHSLIIGALDSLTSELNRFPSRVEISQKTGLSRQTVNKHLKAYFGSQQYHEKKEEFMVMRERLLAKVYHIASMGDLKAARLFIESTNTLAPATNIKNQQNNFIQINGTVITAEQINQLPPDKQNQIQDILTLINQPVNNETDSKNSIYL